MPTAARPLVMTFLAQLLFMVLEISIHSKVDMLVLGPDGVVTAIAEIASFRK